MKRRDTGGLTIAPRGEREIVMTRVFNAPRQLVWEAYTRSELVQQWLGVFDGMTMPICEMDVRPGGTYRWEWRGPEGFRMEVRGVFKEVAAPERLVTTERFTDAWYPGEALNTVTFVESGGKTTMTVVLRYESQQARDLVMKSDMARGVAASYDNLEKVLA